MKNSYQIKLANNIIEQERRLQEDKIEKVAVGAIISADQRVLVLKRQANDFMGDLVELPSGGVDLNETIYNSLLREIQEETGIIIQREKIKFVNSFDYTSGSGKRARQLNFDILLLYLPEIKINLEEHSEFFWISLDELDNYNISVETKECIIKALSKK